MARPTVGLALIVRDEEATLPRLLASIEPGAFDQVALLDTGSEDRTVEVFEAWAASENLEGLVGRFTWCDDFAAARTAADQLLSTDWLCWADADDEIRGADRLQGIAECVGPDVGAVSFYHAWAPGEGAWRIRLHRRGRGRWAGRIHESLIVPGETVARDPDWAVWIHRGDMEANVPRNVRIACRWAEEEPSNPRAIAAAAGELIHAGGVDRARGVQLLRRYLAMGRVQDAFDPDALSQAYWAVDGLTIAAGGGELDQVLIPLATMQPPRWWDEEGLSCADRTQSAPALRKQPGAWQQEVRS